MEITKIVELAIELVTAILGISLIPWIKSKYTTSQIDSAMTWVRIAVQAAEQLFETDEGKLKKKYVKKFLEDNNIKLNKDEIDKAIESAVLELHNELYGQTESGFNTDKNISKTTTVTAAAKTKTTKALKEEAESK